jgi:hypothetical protein
VEGKKRAVVPQGKFIDAVGWLRGIIRATLRPRPRVRMWRWLDEHVVIPEESAGPYSGRLRTSRVPIFRCLYDIIEQPGVHYFAFCASARIGKTLLSICVLLYWIAERFGAPGWLDPTRSTAAKLVRSELDEFLLQCKPVRDLAIAAPPHPASRKFWTTLTKSFRGKMFRILGAGAEAEMHGFNLELAIKNELDQQVHSLTRGAVSSDKFEARTALFTSSRLILDNSTPGNGGEFSPIWQKFLARSQRYCYLPCPHCTAHQVKAARHMGEPEPDTVQIDSIPGPRAPDRGELVGRRAPKPGKTALEDTRNAENGPPLPWIAPSWDEVEPGRSPLSYDPDLRGWQRLTFSIEQKLVPFDEELNYLPKNTSRNNWREEVTGQFKFSQFAIYEERPRADDPSLTEPVKAGYDIEAVEHGTTYECAHCKREIDLTRELLWMEWRCRWVKHNPHEVIRGVPTDKESAQCWAAYNPMQHPGIIAKEFIEAKGDISALIKFNLLTKGEPFIRQGASIKEDDLDRVIARTPVRYVQGQIPLEAECLTMTIDRQDNQFWVGIRAWGILWDHPDWPTWSALVDWGETYSWVQSLEMAGLVPNEAGRVREFKFRRADGTERKYIVTAGLADSGDGDHTKDVYEFCLANPGIFSPYKGCGPEKTLGNPIRLSPVMNKDLDLVLAWSDFFADNLYFDCIKNGASIAGPIHWYLPTNIDRHYRDQLTDEYRGTVNGKKTYISRTKKNHLGDMEKMQRVFSGKIDDQFDVIRAERSAIEAAARAAKEKVES